MTCSMIPYNNKNNATESVYVTFSTNPVQSVDRDDPFGENSVEFLLRIEPRKRSFSDLEKKRYYYYYP